MKIGVLMRKTRFQALESSGLLSSSEGDQSFSFSHIDPSEPLSPDLGYDLILHKVQILLPLSNPHSRHVATSSKHIAKH
jgi:hypothetical protein